MDRISFRFYLDKVLHNKPKEIQDKVQKRVAEVLEISNLEALSPESVGIIIMLVELDDAKTN